MIFFWAYAYAATVVSTHFETKALAEEVLVRCEALVSKWEGSYPIYMSRYLVSGQGYRYRLTIDIPIELSTEKWSQLLESKCVSLEEIPSQISDTKHEASVVVKKTTDASEQKKEISKSQSESRRLIRRLFVKDEEELPEIEDIYRLTQENHQRIYDRFTNGNGQKFHYERTLFDPMSKDVLVVEQTYYQRGEQIRLDVEVKGANAVKSVSLLGENGNSWLITPDGRRKIEQQKLQELLQRFAFENIYSSVLYFSKEIEEDGPWRLLEDIEMDGVYWVLRPIQDSSPLKQAEFFVQQNLLASVILEQEVEMEYRYSEYRNVDGWIPYVVEVFQSGFKIEQIVVKDIQFDVDLPDDFFNSEQVTIETEVNPEKGNEREDSY